MCTLRRVLHRTIRLTKTPGVLYQNFSLSGDALLFGGQYARQNLCDIPDSAQGATQMLPLNRCLSATAVVYTLW